MTTLTSRQRAEGRSLCVKTYTVFTLILVPIIDEYLKSKSINLHTLDPKKMIERMLDEVHHCKYWLNGENSLSTLYEMRDARNGTGHVDSEDMYTNWEIYLGSFVRFCNMLGKKKRHESSRKKSMDSRQSLYRTYEDFHKDTD